MAFLRRRALTALCIGAAGTIVGMPASRDVLRLQILQILPVSQRTAVTPFGQFLWADWTKYGLRELLWPLYPEVRPRLEFLREHVSRTGRIDDRIGLVYALWTGKSAVTGRRAEAGSLIGDEVAALAEWEKLRRLAPGDGRVLALKTLMDQRAVRWSLPQEDEKVTTYASDTRLSPDKRSRAREALEAARIGAEEEADNAFWDYTQAYFLFALGRDAEATGAVDDGNCKPRCDTRRAEIAAATRALYASAGATLGGGEGWGTAFWFTHMVAAKLAWEARELEASGNHRRATARSATILRLLRQTRRNVKSPADALLVPGLPALVGDHAVPDDEHVTAEARRLGVNSFELREELRTELARKYLVAHGAADIARLLKETAQAESRVRRLRDAGERHAKETLALQTVLGNLWYTELAAMAIAFLVACAGSCGRLVRDQGRWHGNEDLASWSIPLWQVTTIVVVSLSCTSLGLVGASNGGWPMRVAVLLLPGLVAAATAATLTLVRFRRGVPFCASSGRLSRLAWLALAAMPAGMVLECLPSVYAILADRFGSHTYSAFWHCSEVWTHWYLKHTAFGLLVGGVLALSALASLCVAAVRKWRGTEPQSFLLLAPSVPGCVAQTFGRMAAAYFACYCLLMVVIVVIRTHLAVWDHWFYCGSPMPFS
jgi:hypothetical protein